MSNKDFGNMKPQHLAVLGVIGSLISALVALIVLFVVRRSAPAPTADGESEAGQNTGGRTAIQPGGDRGTASAQPQPIPQPVPVQPGVDTSMPAHVPHHFTEELIIPGFTETGAQVSEQDDQFGRSPEGV